MKVLVGRHAALFDRASGPALRWLYREVAARVTVDLPDNGRLLDVGTGPGRLLLEISRRRPDAQLTGIDPSADMVGHAHRHLHDARVDDVDVGVAAAEALPFPDDSFDAVVSTLSGHHWADPAAAIAEQVRVLQPGGVLWIVDLRAKPSTKIRKALAERVAANSVSHPNLGRFADLFLVCHRAINRV